MQWLYYKDIVTDIFKNQMILFIAEPVTLAPELAIDFAPRSPEEWLVKFFNPKDNFLSSVEAAEV